MKTPRLIGLFFGFIWRRSNIYILFIATLWTSCIKIQYWTAFLVSLKSSTTQKQPSSTPHVLNQFSSNLIGRAYKMVTIYGINMVLPHRACMVGIYALHSFFTIFIYSKAFGTKLGLDRDLSIGRYSIRDTRVHAIHHIIQYNVESSFKWRWWQK